MRTGIKSQKVDIVKFCKMPLEGGSHRIRNIVGRHFKYCTKILDFSIQFLLLHMFNISASLEICQVGGIGAVLL